MPSIIPKVIYEEERARVLYNTWRRVTLELADGEAPTPWEWEELEDRQRAAWIAAAAEPLDLAMAEYIESAVLSSGNAPH
jgi:hypothetical protein